MHDHHDHRNGASFPARDTQDAGPPNADAQRRLLGALCLTGGFMVVEAIGGVLSGSLALLADAGHMLTDTAALGFACIAVLVAKRPIDTERTYGYHRFPVLAAHVNAITLLLLARISHQSCARCPS